MSDIDEVKIRIDIVEVIGERVTLKKLGETSRVCVRFTTKKLHRLSSRLTGRHFTVSGVAKADRCLIL